MQRNKATTHLIDEHLTAHWCLRRIVRTLKDANNSRGKDFCQPFVHCLFTSYCIWNSEISSLCHVNRLRVSKFHIKWRQ